MPRIKGKYTPVVAMTLQEVADIEGTTTQRISQIEQRALKKIRKYIAERFGDRVKMEDIFHVFKGETLEHEMPKLR